MKQCALIGAVLLALTTGSWTFGGDLDLPYRAPAGCGGPHPFAPAGGWFPYGGGLVHWWPRHCFPRCGVPDDYCHKPLPRACCPSYPPYYLYGPPETGHPEGGCWRAGTQLP